MTNRILLTLIIAVFVLSLSGCMLFNASPEEEDVYELVIEIDGEGTVTPAVGRHRYQKDETVTLRAEPAEGWSFSRWQGPVRDMHGRETTTRVFDDQTIRAVFIELPQASAGGTGSCARARHVQSGEGVRVEYDL